jgi:hypothetical protein
MTDPILSGNLNVGVGGIIVLPGAPAGGFGGGPVPPAPPPVPVYDMIITGQAVIGGNANLVVGGFDRTLVVNALLHNELFAPGLPFNWATPGALVRAVNLYFCMNQGVDFGIQGTPWVADAVSGAGGFGAINSLMVPYRNGIVNGHLCAHSGTLVPPDDIYFRTGAPFAPWNGLGGLPIGVLDSVYGTWINGYAILTLGGGSPNAYNSLAPGVAWTLATGGMVGIGMMPQIPSKTICTSLSNRDVLYLILDDTGGFGISLWASFDEGQTFFSFGILPAGPVPTIMLATGPFGFAGGPLIMVGPSNTIWQMDIAGWVAAATYNTPNPLDTIVDMWWDETTGRIWALIWNNGGGVRIVISDDQGATWSTWFNGPGFGATAGNPVYSMGFVGQFR